MNDRFSDTVFKSDSDRYLKILSNPPIETLLQIIDEILEEDEWSGDGEYIYLHDGYFIINIYHIGDVSKIRDVDFWTYILDALVKEVNGQNIYAQSQISRIESRLSSLPGSLNS